MMSATAQQRISNLNGQHGTSEAMTEEIRDDVKTIVTRMAAVERNQQVHKWYFLITLLVALGTAYIIGTALKKTPTDVYSLGEQINAKVDNLQSQVESVEAASDEIELTLWAVGAQAATNQKSVDDIAESLRTMKEKSPEKE